MQIATSLCAIVDCHTLQMARAQEFPNKITTVQTCTIFFLALIGMCNVETISEKE